VTLWGSVYVKIAQTRHVVVVILLRVLVVFDGVKFVGVQMEMLEFYKIIIIIMVQVEVEATLLDQITVLHPILIFSSHISLHI
jgi:hypothetical protein